MPPLKKYLLYILALLTMVCIGACQKIPNHRLEKQLDIPTFEKRAYSQIPINGLDSFYASRLFLGTQHLLIQEWIPYQKIHLVNLKDFQLQNSIGSENGPTRLARDISCNGQITVKEDSVFSFFKSNKRGFFKLNLSKSGNPLELHYAKLGYPEELYLDKIYLTTPKSSVQSSQIAFYADEQSVIRHSPIENETVLKKIDRNRKKAIALHNLIAANIYGHTSTYNTASSELYIAYYYFNHIDFIDSDLNLSQRIYFGKPHLELPRLDDEGYPSEENTFYFGHITANGNKLCLLYFDTPLSDIENGDKSKIIILDKNSLQIYGIQIDLQIAHMQLSNNGKELYFLGESDQFPQNFFKVKL